MKKIGLLLIATGKYDVYIQNIIESAKKYFLPNEEVHFFLFTDSEFWLNKKEEKFNSFFRKHKSFPAPTLERYETFLTQEERLSQMDYLFYCDVDMLFVDKVKNNILSDRVAVVHPAFVSGNGTPERRIESTAYISEQENNKYYVGGFNGGKASEFLKMSKILSENIDKDNKNSIIAIWHDESHLNKYFLDNPPTLVLPPSYCYPESHEIPFKKILVALDKNHEEIRR